MEGKVKLCVLCNTNIIPKSHAKSLATCPAGLETTFYDMLLQVFKEWGGSSSLLENMDPLLPVFKETRLLCASCCTIVKNAHSFKLKINAAINEESYVMKHMEQTEVKDANKGTQEIPDQEELRQPRAGPSTPVESDHSDMEIDTEDVSKCATKRVAPVSPSERAGSQLIKYSTPIGKKIQKALTIGRTRVIVQNQLALRVNEEMKTFTEKTMLRSFSSDKGFLPDGLQLAVEMERYCPTVLKLIDALVNGSGEMSAPIQTIVGLAVYRRSQLCNALQKAIGFTLFYNCTSKKVIITKLSKCIVILLQGQGQLLPFFGQVYDILHKMGLCVTYNTILSLLDQEVKNHDEHLLQWKEVIK